MEMDIIEYKIRFDGDHNKWEDIPAGQFALEPFIPGIVTTPEHYLRGIWVHAEDLAGKKVFEIRWNYLGSSQGHYYGKA